MKEEKLAPIMLIVLLVVQLVFLGMVFLRLNSVDRNLVALQQMFTTIGSSFPVEGITANVSTGDGPYKGSPEAPVVIVEFSDFTCSACKAAQPVLEELLAKYQGQTMLAFRYFPLAPEGTDPFIAAVAAECANQQGAFWKMHDTLFAHQESLSQDSLIGYASDLGLDQAAFTACLTSEEAMSRVRADIAAGQEYGVHGTPTFFINGRRVSGSLPLAAFEALIQEALGK